MRRVSFLWGGGATASGHGAWCTHISCDRTQEQAVEPAEAPVPDDELAAAHQPRITRRIGQRHHRATALRNFAAPVR
ncbi:hypothetical protein [Saccharopolyspora phatthalungensis]|uniref:Uncharacterized protein n=1 Tax=Saccharopolyspora phatthalungensis TaxID=664693 RepID=A0A840QBN5_9PSEU|nr:hypothetical protein [Saccharopolyspora phatthalungensis]MBB5156058.1 hypothetical protein [Saccharopolyspora phatthalungensis]